VTQKEQQLANELAKKRDFVREIDTSRIRIAECVNQLDDFLLFCARIARLILLKSSYQTFICITRFFSTAAWLLLSHCLR